MSQLGDFDYVGVYDETKTAPIVVPKSDQFVLDKTHLKKLHVDGEDYYKLCNYVAPMRKGIEIRGYSGLCIPIPVLDRLVFIQPLDSSDHFALGLSIKDKENVMPCILQYGFNDCVLGYRKNEKFYFFIAQVENSGYHKRPDIAVDRIECYYAYFIKPLPKGFKYVLFNNDSIQVICILDERNNVIKHATF